jgi:glucokinase
MKKACYLGVELGGTKQQLAIGTETGELIEVICEKIVLLDGAKTIRVWLQRKVPALIAKYNTGTSVVKRACIGFGGPIETKTGRILSSVQVQGWEDFPLKIWFEQAFGIQTDVINDTVAGGYGELILGAGKESDHFFYTNIGTGIGGALFVNKRNYDGAGFGAVYMGNTYIPDPTSPVPGSRIKLENICSGAATERRLRTQGYVPADSLLMEMCGGDISQITCKMWGEAAEKRDPFALREIDFYARSYAVGLGNMMTSVSPDLVAIGGGVANIGEVLLQPIRKHVEEVVFISLKNRYEIVQGKLLDNTVILGAILYAAGMFTRNKQR